MNPQHPSPDPLQNRSTSWPRPPAKTIVIGAGLAGLTAARVLNRAGWPVTVLEADRAVGGRLRTERVEGFTLDRGFQVIFTAYPALRRQLEPDELELVPFPSAAVIVNARRRERLGDPRRDPASLPGTLLASSFTLNDRLRLAQLALHLSRPAVHELLGGPESSTRTYLERRGFSARAIQRFFAPFFGGIFLRRDLGTSAQLFRYYFRMLLDGVAALPRGGIQALPEALADGMELKLGCRVRRLEPGDESVRIYTDAEPIEADHVIVATDPLELTRLTGVAAPRAAQGATYLDYASSEPIDDEPRLLLAGAPGVINNAHWRTNLDPSLAPEGQHLLTVTLLGTRDADDEALDAAVRRDLRAWYGERVRALRLLRVTRLPFAQFAQPPGYTDALVGHATPLPRVLIASEATDMSSIQGAMASGERAAAALLGDTLALARPRGA